GVCVLTVGQQNGEVTCRDDRWSRKSAPAQRFIGALYGNPIGSPSYDTGQGVQRVKALLSQEGWGGTTELPVNGIIVFTADRVRLRVERCSFPATTAKELRRVISKLKGRLNQSQLAQVRAAFEAAGST